MDPLSITVGIIGILGAGGQLATTLKKIHSLKGAPEELRALNSEISAIGFIVRQLNDLCRHRDESFSIPLEANLRDPLTRMEGKLLELEKLFAFKLTKPGSTATEIQVDRSRWIRYKPKVQRIREELRGITSTYTDVIKCHDCRSSVRRLELQAKQCYTANTKPEAGRQCNRSHEVAVLEFKRQLAKTLVPASRQGQKRTTRAIQGAKVVPYKNRPPADGRQIASINCTPLKSIHSLVLVPHRTANHIRTRDMSHQNCALLCTCFCHVARILRSPRWLEPIFGALIFASVGPYATFQDSRQDIRRSRSSSYTRLSYILPRWLTDHVLSIVFTYAHLQAPGLCMRLLRLRSYKEAIFVHAEDGETDKIKELIAKGQGSVLDFSEVGWSALHYAVVRQRTSTVKYLLSIGADVTFENSWGETVYDMLCLLLFGNVDSMQSVHEICSIFNACDIAESQGFSILHEIVVGLRHINFHDELESSSRNLIDMVDNTGKTPLAWAARRGDFQKVEQLLKFGANPRIVDKTGRSPLHYSILSHDSRSLLALLKADSDVHQQTYNSEHTPLRSAIWWSDNVSSVKLFLRFGSDVNALECDGMAALHEAAYRSRVQICIYLLENSGASIDARTESGLTALMISIERGSYGCLRTLLAHGADHRLKDKNGSNILHLAARSGDTTTVGILLRYSLPGLDVTARDSEGKTALALAKEQSHTDPQWLTTFRELLNKLQAAAVVDSLIKGVSSCRTEAMEEHKRNETWEDAREFIAV